MKAIFAMAASIGICLVAPASAFSTLASPRIPRCFSLRAANDLSNDSQPAEQTPLIDLQTFLKLCDLVQTGGEAKAAIQAGEVRLNFDVETRRAKKLFVGDEVTFGEVTLDVFDQVSQKGYAYRAKKKKAKPAPRVMENGSLEFGGRYRSEEWRAERLQKKADRKAGKKVE
ncbi:hypothetical protein ACHAWF_003036 [Thalassiosira exigua]